MQKSFVILSPITHLVRVSSNGVLSLSLTEKHRSPPSSTIALRGPPCTRAQPAGASYRIYIGFTVINF